MLNNQKTENCKVKVISISKRKVETGPRRRRTLKGIQSSTGHKKAKKKARQHPEEVEGDNGLLLQALDSGMGGRTSLRGCGACKVEENQNGKAKEGWREPEVSKEVEERRKKDDLGDEEEEKYEKENQEEES